MKDYASRDTELRTVSDPVWRILTGAAAFGAGVFVCGAVGSYTPTDPSWNAATGAAVQNLFGSTGAVFADLARQTLGWSGWIAGLALMIGGAMRAVLVGQPRVRRWLLGALAVPLSAACFAAWPVPESWPLSAGLGGMMGDGLFNLIVLPFSALMLPAPQTWAGFLAGGLAMWCALSALGFGRRDAQLLQETAAIGGRHAVTHARGAGGMLIRIGQKLVTRQPAVAQEEEEIAPARTVTAVREDRTLIIKSDEDYVPTSRYLRDLDEEEDEDYARSEDGDWEDEDEDEEGFEAANDEDDSPSRPPRFTFSKPNQAPRSASIPKVAQPERRRVSTRLPPIELMQEPEARREVIDEDALIAKAARLSEVLKEFGIRGRIKEVRPGPVITLFEMEPAPGVKSSRVISLADDIARSMSAVSARVAVVPGKNAIGIELPNEERETVWLRSLLEAEAYTGNRSSLPMALGEDIGGLPTVVDLAKMPHLLIAGTTGSGKSVGVNAMILSLLYRHTPEQCRFIMIDPKKLELSVYEGIPHLLAPVVTEADKAVNALKWTVREMESRYELMSKAGVRNLGGYNEKAAKYRTAGEEMTRKVQTAFDDRGKPVYETEILPTDHIPNIVVVIDEMADLMLVAGKEVESCVQRLAQMARAAGIHLITATQRPSVDVITGTIKANFPTRISYMVTNKVDSRTILNEQGAEQLLGMGDLLYQAPGKKSQRLHGPFVSDEDVGAVADWLRDQGEPDYVMDILDAPDDGSTGSAVMDAILGTGGGGDEDEGLFAQAIQIVVRDQRASTSYLQRRLKVGYNKAAGLIDRLEEEGIISAPNHAGKREVLAGGNGGGKASAA
ncbi:DNA translocase FtsK 4TM domain-containing protein [Hyphomonas sp. WL0036]|uniref:FtsK/SpoIIIE family DNA translocase n=1 Tax=Hyphomonas sediminis TaxID=2866160 RepID=UPI001C7EA8DA|nr:DNA translocase FtsK 4TM domain-containing protein [Hyphomonas sediminis]MBY9065908.1 DNA translocase FtsK 4TM domain-containing protein [Hyphomonas sediminis]